MIERDQTPQANQEPWAPIDHLILNLRKRLRGEASHANPPEPSEPITASPVRGDPRIGARERRKNGEAIRDVTRRRTADKMREGRRKALRLTAGVLALGGGLILIGPPTMDRVRKDFLDGVLNWEHGVIFPYYRDRNGFSVDNVRDDLKLFFVEHPMGREQFKQSPAELLAAVNLPDNLIAKLKKSKTEIVFADTTSSLTTDGFITDYRNMVMAHKALLVLLARDAGFFSKTGLYASQNRSGLETYLAGDINSSLSRIQEHLNRLSVRDGFAQAIKMSGGVTNFCMARLVDPNELTKNDKSMWLYDRDFEKVLRDKINLNESSQRKPLGT